MPQPRLIDPAVFYDIVKIRRAVDEATEDSVRASTGLSTAALNQSLRYDPFGGGGGGPQSKMSKERIFKIRQKAVKALAKAYTLDEVAASVATMQSTSSLEEVALHVQRRDKNDLDAKYVQFFHDKIPSRMMEQYTPLEPLTEIIMTLPWEMQGAALRTRALVQIFKGMYEGAALDLTAGLRIAQELKNAHKPGADQLVLARDFRLEQEKWNRSGRDWRQVPQLKEEEQPSSLEQQILFNRAGVYLTVACQHVDLALNGLKEAQQKAKAAAEDANGEPAPLSAAEKQAHQVRLDARKKVKTNAKRALKDYLAFLEHFDYTPGLPFEITNEIMRRVYDLANGNKSQTMGPKNRLVELNGNSSSSSEESTPTSEAMVKHQNASNGSSGVEWDADGWPRLPKPQIYAASALFAATPPCDLPLFPDPDASAAKQAQRSNPLSAGTRETVTYHPLLTDALHSLLLCHALLQTSSAEVLRHAHNAARLARIADGYPIFQAARSPARADWIEVLRRASNWIGLSHPWQKLCQPAPLPTQAGGNYKDAAGVGDEPGASKLHKKPAETEEQKRERRKQEAILDALADERVTDEDSFQRAVRAREKRAMEDEEGLSGPLNDRVLREEKDMSDDAYASVPRRWAQDDGKEYPISTDRAEAIARWIREAPLSMGGKKKRPARKKPAGKATGQGAGGVDGVVGGMAGTRLSTPGQGDEEVD